MTITAAKRTKRGKIALWADEAYLFSVEDAAWASCGLSVGAAAEEWQLNALLAESRRIEAKHRALSLLSARSYTGRQLTDRLAAKTDNDAAASAVERMTELGLIDDAAYADRLACELYKNRFFALRRIRFELQKRGIDGDLIDEALSQFDPEKDVPRAAALLRTRFSSLSGEADRRRAAALLERYGYHGGDIRAALHIFDQNETEEFE